MRAALAVLLLGASVLAQGTPKKKPVFDVPEPAPREKAGEEERPESALQRTLERLAPWPGAASRRAAEQLIVLKEKSLPLVAAVLVSPEPRHAPLKPGAAYVLGRIGGREHALTLLLVAAEKEQHREAAVFLEAALQLDREAAVAEAFRYFHLAETTLRHEATKFVLNHVSQSNLPQVLELLDRRSADRPFTREIGLRLLDRLVDAGEVPWTGDGGTGAGEYFYRALGDESPQVAARAMRLLAGRDDPENVKTLNHLITREMSFWRQRSYAALALAVYSTAYRTQPFEAETLKVLQGDKGLRHPKETLARASAALALAQAALRTSDRELVRLLDREIPIVLIDAVGARRHHYRDFGSVMPLAYSMLRRITGQPFPDHAPRWAAWWRDHGRLFRAKRELIGIDAEDLGALEVEVAWPQGPGAERLRFTAGGSQRPSFLHGRAFALPRDELSDLASFLAQRGFFDTPEADEAGLDPDAALVVMRVGDLDRKVAFAGDEAGRARRDEILLRANRLRADYSWQLWWDIDAQPSWEIFLLENRKWFREHPAEEERTARLRAMAAASVDDLLSVEDRVAAVRFVASLPGGGAALGDAEVKAFLEAAAAEREVNAFVAEVVGLLVPAAGERAVGALVDLLAGQLGLDAKILLAKLCGSLGFERLAALAEDPRWVVRRASVAALGTADAARARPILEARLADEEILVRVEAVEALARRKDPAVLPVLAELAGSHLPEVRASAAYAYGLLGSAQARQAMRGLLQDRNADVKVRAVEGLAEGGDPEAAPLLVGVFRDESDVRVRASAANALVSLETPELADRLVERLQLTDAMDPTRVALVNVLARFESDRPVEMLRMVLLGDDPLSADAAALGLARRWDEAALVQLIKMVKSGNNTLTAVRHLQLLTSATFESESYSRQAENYTGWATTNGDGNPRLWFRKALEERGYDVSALQEWAAAPALGPVPDEAVPVLLRALRDGDWFIQRNASFLLSQRIGATAPRVLDYASPPGEVEAAVRAYHDWWSARRAEAKAREAG